MWGIRLLCLALACVCAIGGLLPIWLARVVPGLSPLTVLAVAIAGRGWYAGVWWLIPPLLILLLAVARGRLFCRWICPTGTLQALVPRVLPGRRLVRWRLNRLLLWAILGAALAGLPLYHVLDPLSIFARAMPWVHGIFSPAMLVLGLLLPALLVLAAFQPMVWCSHICPLGALFDGVHVRAGGRAGGMDPDRRRVLGGLACGVIPALVLPRAVGGHRLGASPPLLPPGAVSPSAFARDCCRCHACVNVCPTGILRVGWPGDRNLLAWFHPRMDPRSGGCAKDCYACTRVCPTGAIRPLSLSGKHRRQVGVARVRREQCLAWHDGVACTVCFSYCAYDAIRTNRSEEWIDRPEAYLDRCTGCGYCEHYCPVARDGKAIVVEGLAQPRVIEGRPE